MKITSIDLYSDRLEENLKFSLQRADPFEKYMVRQITGLDVEEVVPRLYGYGSIGIASDPGARSRFYEFTAKPKDVVMRVALNPNITNNENYSDLRDDLYRMISSTRTGQLILYLNSGPTAVAKLEGHITKFEAGHFNALPEIQITVRCENPLPEGVNPVIYDSTVDEYPDPIVIDGVLHVPDSLSTAPHGFSFRGVFTGSSAPIGSGIIRIREETPSDWEFILDYDFLTGDELVFSSISGKKSLYVIKAVDDSLVYLLDKLQATSMWPIIFPGRNEFHNTHYTVFTYTRVEYYPTYWGV